MEWLALGAGLLGAGLIAVSVARRRPPHAAPDGAEAIRRAGSLDSEKVRDAILAMDLHTVFGAFKVDEVGIQIAHRMVVFQWQDGKKVIVWPDELADGKIRFPTPSWSNR